MDEQAYKFNVHITLSIICVNWNSIDYLREFIASIYENTHGVSFEGARCRHSNQIGEELLS